MYQDNVVVSWTHHFYLKSFFKHKSDILGQKYYATWACGKPYLSIQLSTRNPAFFVCSSLNHVALDQVQGIGSALIGGIHHHVYLLVAATSMHVP